MMRDHAMMPSDSFLANEIIHKRKKIIVFLYSIIYISFLYFIQNFIVELPVLCLYLILFIFTVLLFIFLSYECVIEKTKTLMTLHPEGRLTRLLSGRMLLHIFCFIIALFFAFLAQIILICMSKEDFTVMSIGLLTMPWIYSTCSRISKAESIPWLFYQRSIRWTLLATAILILLIQVVAVIAEYYPHSHYESLDAALNARPLKQTRSSIMNWIVDIASFLETVKIYFISKQNGLLYSLLMIFGSLISFSPIYAIFALVFLPGSEIRRIFIPQYLQTTHTPSCNSVHVIVFSFIFVIFFLGFATIFAHIEMHSNDYSIEKYLNSTKKNVVIYVDGRYYDGDLSSQIDELKEKYKEESQRLTTLMVKEKAELCGGMRANVDRFLDWYYSLGTEYLRLGNALIGNGPEYLASKLKEHLQNGLDDGTYGDIQNKLYQLDMKYDQEIAILKKKYEITEKEAEGHQIISLPPNFLETVPNHSSINFNQRMFTSTGVGAITGGIAAKAISKPALKTAAAALVKLAASKAVTGGGGAVASGAGVGAAIGSILPGVGTAAGAFVGGVIAGIATWVTTDVILLKFDEDRNREKMRQEILEEINAVCQ